MKRGELGERLSRKGLGFRDDRGCDVNGLRWGDSTPGRGFVDDFFGRWDPRASPLNRLLRDVHS